MSPPNPFWNKKTLKHCAWTTILAFILLACWFASTVMSWEAGYAKGYAEAQAQQRSGVTP